MIKVDEELSKLGFEKIKENEIIVVYIRHDEKFKFVQKVDMLEDRIFSYQAGGNSDGFNNCVSLKYHEIRLFMKKYKQMKRKYKWGKRK